MQNCIGEKEGREEIGRLWFRWKKLALGILDFGGEDIYAGGGEASTTTARPSTPVAQGLKAL